MLFFVGLKFKILISFEKHLNNHLTFLEKCLLNLTNKNKETELMPKMILWQQISVKSSVTILWRVFVCQKTARQFIFYVAGFNMFLLDAGQKDMT